MKENDLPECFIFDNVTIQYTIQFKFSETLRI